MWKPVLREMARWNNEFIVSGDLGVAPDDLAPLKDKFALKDDIAVLADLDEIAFGERRRGCALARVKFLGGFSVLHRERGDEPAVRPDIRLEAGDPFEVRLIRHMPVGPGGVAEATRPGVAAHAGKACFKGERLTE